MDEYIEVTYRDLSKIMENNFIGVKRLEETLSRELFKLIEEAILEDESIDEPIFGCGMVTGNPVSNYEFSGPLRAIEEVERMAPEHYQHIKEILEKLGFIQSIPLNDKTMLHLKKVVMPVWQLTDIETLRPMEVKNVTVEFAIKVRLQDLSLTGNEWRVIPDKKWHTARFTDNNEDSFEVLL